MRPTRHPGSRECRCCGLGPRRTSGPSPPAAQPRKHLNCDFHRPREKALIIAVGSQCSQGGGQVIDRVNAKAEAELGEMGLEHRDRSEQNREAVNRGQEPLGCHLGQIAAGHQLSDGRSRSQRVLVAGRYGSQPASQLIQHVIRDLRLTHLRHGQEPVDRDGVTPVPVTQRPVASALSHPRADGDKVSGHHPMVGGGFSSQLAPGADRPPGFNLPAPSAAPALLRRWSLGKLAGFGADLALAA